MNRKSFRVNLHSKIADLLEAQRDELLIHLSIPEKYLKPNATAVTRSQEILTYYSQEGRSLTDVEAALQKVASNGGLSGQTATPTASVRIPARFQIKLSKVGLLSTIERMLLDVVIGIVDNSPFFLDQLPLHGLRRITEYLTVFDAIIPEEAFSAMTAEDVVVILYVVAIETLIVHIQEEELIALSKDQQPRAFLSGGHGSWFEAWQDFCSEARRFDGRKLQRLFGTPEPVAPPSGIGMSAAQRRLAGEFVRRHRGSLAAERLLLEQAKQRSSLRMDARLAAVAVTVLRALDRPVRDCLDQLGQDKRREHGGAHPTYLAVLMRISEFLESRPLDPESPRFRPSRLRVPLSYDSWQRYPDVEDIHCSGEDPEGLTVLATPPNVEEFLLLSELLSTLQVELDRSWAIIGEVYGRMQSQKSFGFAIRRVRSTLEDVRQLASKVTYLPCEARFATAGADLLKLLVGPLYGNRPEVGIRELVQNAVDACRELADYGRQIDLEGVRDRRYQESDVLLCFDIRDDRTGTITISDRGIGMTAEIILRYFLTAGASYRRSDAWRRMHEDSPGRSRILRSGRFGVGALAAFLIGDRITVATRHVTTQRGLKFSCSMHDDAIQLDTFDCEVGTAISIEVTDPRVGEKLGFPEIWATHGQKTSGVTAARVKEEVWDWFNLPEPTFRCSFNGTLHQSRSCVPSPDVSLPLGWRSIYPSNFTAVHWTYQSNYRQAVPRLTCNGIRVLDSSDSLMDTLPMKDSDSSVGRFHEWEDRPSLLKPRLSVFDPDGYLPLDLSRMKLSDELPFVTELTESVCSDFIAFLLIWAPELPPKDSVSLEAWKALQYSGFRSFNSYGHSYLSDVLAHNLVNNTFSLSTPQGLLIHKCDAISMLPRRKYNYLHYPVRFSKNRGLMFYRLGGLTVADTTHWVRGALNIPSDGEEWSVFQLHPTGVRLVIPCETFSMLTTRNKIPRKRRVSYTVEVEKEHWMILRCGNCPPLEERLEISDMLQTKPEEEMDSIVEVYLPSESKLEAKPSVLDRVWNEVIGKQSIPYDKAERRRALAHSFVALKPYIEAQERELEAVEAQERRRRDK